MIILFRVVNQHSLVWFWISTRIFRGFLEEDEIDNMEYGLVLVTMVAQKIITKQTIWCVFQLNYPALINFNNC